MSELFVIPCKFDPARPVILDCVARIREHHPDAVVLIVDSCSDDLSYIRELENVALAGGNREYMNGAFKVGSKVGKNLHADTYHFIADSLLLNKPLPAPEPLRTVRWFQDPPCGWGWDADGVSLGEYGGAQLAKLGLTAEPGYKGIMGPMFSCTREVVDDLERLGYFNLLPNDKYEQCAFERITGIVLEHLGFDVTVSYQGEHCAPGKDHWSEYPDEYVTKLNMGRM